MADLYVFPDLEAALVAHLKSEFASRTIVATVATKVPTSRPARMVRISGLGGSRRNLITDESSALFECWAPDAVSASELARITRAIVDEMDGWTSGVWISDVGTGTPVPFPDPDIDAPRYQFTAQILTQGQILE